MPAPAVIGYMPLCVTPRSRIRDEQGVGKFPIWKLYNRVKGIVNQYIDEPYRDFLSFPYHVVDQLKAEESFYWYTPSCDTIYVRMSCAGDDRDYYKGILKETLAHYQSVVDKLKSSNKTEDADLLQRSLKHAGESEDNVYCGDGRVVATVWGMCLRQEQNVGESILVSAVTPVPEMHTVRYELGELGSTDKPTVLRKSQGSKIRQDQVPSVSPKVGYECTGWDCNPVGAVVTEDLLFTAQYRKISHGGSGIKEQKPSETAQRHHVRFLTPDNQIIKELHVEHGKQIQPGDVPQLPSIEGTLCLSWKGDPYNDKIDADQDYYAVRPQISKHSTHTVRFLTPDGKMISQSQVESNTTLSRSMIPPLPVVNGKICLQWDSNPMGTVINSDRDFVAVPPKVVGENEKEQPLHTVRFLNIDGGELSRVQVPHGAHLQPNQIPQQPVVNGEKRGRWFPNPTKRVINRDTDFVIRDRRTRHWSWFRRNVNVTNHWGGRWLLYVVLFLFFVFLVLYIMYLCNPCSK